MLTDDAKRLVVGLRDHSMPRPEANALANSLSSAVPAASPADSADALGILAQSITALAGQLGDGMALVCGAMIEGGVNPAPMVAPMLQRLRDVIPPARRLFDACTAETPKDADDDQFEQTRAQLAAKMPEEGGCWDALGRLYRPAIALFSFSPQARREAQDLLPLLSPMTDDNQGTHWIAKILTVLDDEPYVAIEPSTQSGIGGRMSGISDNFQLNVLLMDVFPAGKGRGLLARFRGPKRRVSESAAQIARGEGPQQSGEYVTGCWNLYAWKALRADRSLPDVSDLSSNAHWIWNEGIPADIPTFDDYRVILIGPASYQRGWQAQRDFAKLRATLTIERQISPSDVRQWLDRLRDAVRA